MIQYNLWYNRKLNDMALNSFVFSDNDFIMSYHILTEKNRKWTVRDFEKYKISKRLAADFYNLLIDKGILARKNPFGPKSFCLLKNSAKLKKMCVEQFVIPEKKTINFVSTRDLRDILKEIKNLRIEFYLAKFSGIKPNLRYVQDEKLYIFLPDLNLFRYESISMLEKKLGIHRVNGGGNMLVFLPRYRKFLRHNFQEINGFRMPSDFYSYLDMSTLPNPRGQEQADNMLAKLKNQEGSFV